MDRERCDGPGYDRRSFIKSSAAVAAGAAAVAAPAALALRGDTGPAARKVVPNPAAPTPEEPVTAYVRDATRGEVTVMSGTGETTFEDPALVKHLLDASQTLDCDRRWP